MSEKSQTRRIAPTEPRSMATSSPLRPKAGRRPNASRPREAARDVGSPPALSWPDIRPPHPGPPGRGPLSDSRHAHAALETGAPAASRRRARVWPAPIRWAARCSPKPGRCAVHAFGENVQDSRASAPPAGVICRVHSARRSAMPSSLLEEQPRGAEESRIRFHFPEE